MRQRSTRDRTVRVDLSANPSRRLRMPATAPARERRPPLRQCDAFEGVDIDRIGVFEQCGVVVPRARQWMRAGNRGAFTAPPRPAPADRGRGSAVTAAVQPVVPGASGNP